MEILEQYTTHIAQEDISTLDANYIGDFAIRISFNNGHQRLVDFKPFLESAKHPSVKKYLDESLF